jgi:hypothetical protein
MIRAWRSWRAGCAVATPPPATDTPALQSALLRLAGRVAMLSISLRRLAKHRGAADEA